MTTVLSFDIGIYNLAYQLLQIPETKQVEECKILQWGVLSLKSEEEVKKPSFSQTSEALVKLLHKHFDNLKPGTILIENQPCMKNPIMKSIQMIIYSFFTIKKFREQTTNEIHLVSATSKLKLKQRDVIDLSSLDHEKSKYKKNKKMSILLAKTYLDLSNSCNKEWIDFFYSSKKQDDLADTYCFNLNFIEKQLGA